MGEKKIFIKGNCNEAKPQDFKDRDGYVLYVETTDPTCQRMLRGYEAVVGNRNNLSTVVTEINENWYKVETNAETNYKKTGWYIFFKNILKRCSKETNGAFVAMSNYLPEEVVMSV